MFMNDHSAEWFSRQLGTFGEYFVKHKQLLVRKQGVYKNIATYIDNEDICISVMTWL